MAERTPAPGWQERAACGGHGNDDWLIRAGDNPGGALDAAERARVARARAVCAGCPVAVQCLAFALASGEDGGVWGGIYLSERAVATLRRAAATPPPEPPIAA